MVKLQFIGICLFYFSKSADNARNNSERIRNEAVRLMRDREDKTVLTQRDADRRIGERLHDVTFWRSELQAELERNMNETHHLMETRKNLEKALQETEGPMRVTSECIYHREGRKVLKSKLLDFLVFKNLINSR